MSKFWRKTIFWEKLKETCNSLGVPSVVGLAVFQGDVAACIGGGAFFLARWIAIWMTDHDNNGVVDLFE